MSKQQHPNAVNSDQDAGKHGSSPGEDSINQLGEAREAYEQGVAASVNPTELHLQQIVLLEEQLLSAEKRVEDLQLRHLAEQQNIQRRTEHDIAKAYKFSLEKFVRELLPVIDSFERAVALADIENQELLPMVEGVNLTLKSLYDVIGKFGIMVLDEVGVPFNPELHQAMQLVDSELHGPNQVVVVLQKGYTLNDRLLRPAMVAVSR